MKIRHSKLDKIFSRLIRERDNWTCQNCGANQRHYPATMDCAHIMGRRSAALRWHPANAIALCKSCHIFYTQHPFDWRDFCVSLFGEDRVAELRLISSKPVKWTKAVREDIYQFYHAIEKRGEKIEPHEVMHEFERPIENGATQ